MKEPTHCLLVHGYNADSGVGSIDRVIPSLERLGFTTVQYDYNFANGPLTGLLGALVLNGRRARDLYDHVALRGPLVAIGHSNGCAILHRLMHAHPGLISKAVYVNPALDSDAEPPAGTRLSVFHTPGDRAVTAAKYIPFVRWGNMGAVGYTGSNPDVINVNTGSSVHGWRTSSSHSDKFNLDNVGYWAAHFAGHL